MMTWKKFLLGLLILLLAPTLVLVLLSLLVMLLNGRPQQSQLQTSVKPAVVFPWQETAYTYKFNGEDLQKTEPKSVDIVFLIDVSGSMRQSIPAMAKAAKSLAEALNKSEPNLVRYGLVRFDSEAEIAVPFTNDVDQLYAGLSNLNAMTGMNNPDKMFTRLEEIESSLRPSARRIGVFYTDGHICTNGNTSYDAAADVAQQFKDRQWAFFSVSPPGETAHGVMARITGSSARVYSPGNENDLQRQFGILGLAILDAAGHTARFATSIDGRHYDTPVQGLPWTRDDTGNVSRTFNVLPFANFAFSHPLDPDSAGLWSVGRQPAKLSYLDINNQPQTIYADRKPRLLSITWFVIFLALLPAILWCIYNWPRKQPKREQGDMPAIPARQKPRTVELPPLPKHPRPRGDLVPTLFIGLGDTGQHALDATAWELEQADNGHHQAPYHFLHLGLMAPPVNTELPFNALRKRQPTQVTASTDILQAQQYLPETAAPDHLRWFPIKTYRDRSASELNLANENAKNDRVLSRLALFRWLETGDLLDALASACQTLRDIPSTDGTRQIVLFAAWQDGFGSGSVLDLARILNRIIRDHQQEDELKIVPEITLVLIDPDENPDHPNRQALALELGTLAITGAYPYRTTYVPNHPLLDRQDNQAPAQAAFSIAKYNRLDASAQCGQWSVLQTERIARCQLLSSHRRIDAVQPIRFDSHAIHVIPGLTREKIAQDLVMRLLGPEILLKLSPSPSGNYTPEPYEEGNALRLLENWQQSETSGLLLQSCLGAAYYRNLEVLNAKIKKELGRVDQDKYKEELTAHFYDLKHQLLQSINEKLHGNAFGKLWQRTWFPGQATAVLHVLGVRLEELANAFSSDPYNKAGHLMELAHIAKSAANALESWREDLANQSSRLFTDNQKLGERIETLSNLSQRTYLQHAEPVSEAGMPDHGPENCLRSWLKTTDTLSPLRQNIYFQLELKGDDAVQVHLIISLEQEQIFNAAPRAVDYLAQVTSQLTASVPNARIGGGLKMLKEKDRKALARSLMNRHSRTVEAIVMVPEHDPLPPSEASQVLDFKEEIAAPADHGLQTEVVSKDQSAIRRVELALLGGSDQVSDTINQQAEVLAEQVRKRIEQVYALQINTLPPALRLAVADKKAFAAFAMAYQAGFITRLEDELGRTRWAYKDQFLTFSESASLAEAAIHFAAWEPRPTTNPTAKVADELFHPLDAWISKQEGNPVDALTLAAIRLQSPSQEQAT